MPTRSTKARHSQKPGADPQVIDDSKVQGGDPEILDAIYRLQTGGGAPEAFEPIFKRYYRPLYRFFSNRAILKEEADDLAQMTLIRAYQNIGQFRFQASFSTWLHYIGENVWRNAVRDRQAGKRGENFLVELSLDEAESALLVPDSAPGPFESVHQKERIALVRHILSEMPERMRECNELSILHGLDPREIASRTKTDVSTVRVQLYRGRKYFKQTLGAADLDE